MFVTEDYLHERAKRGDRPSYEAALAQVPDVEPDPMDKIESAATSAQKGWDDAKSGKTKPVSELREDVDAG